MKKFALPGFASSIAFAAADAGGASASAEPKANLYDFADLSDLPEDVAKPLQTETRDNAKVYAAFVTGAKDAGYESLNIREITAVAFRALGKVPTQATVRAYLNEAVKLGLISKPTRASYSWNLELKSVEGDDEGVEEAGAEGQAAPEADQAPAAEADPLAGL